MLLYAQALIWGNSCFALAITGIYRFVIFFSVCVSFGFCACLGLYSGAFALSCLGGFGRCCDQNPP
jgi:hypothetical protein